MFFHRLTEDQKHSFLALATKMLLADGRVAPEEDALMAILRGELGLSRTASPHDIHGPLRTEIFASHESRVTITLGLMVMAYVDQFLHADESTVLNEVCAAFGFSGDQVERMRSWARREAELILEINSMIAE